MMTRDAPSKHIAASSIEKPLTEPFSADVVVPAVSSILPKAPKRTFTIERFIALHISRQSMMPDAPTKEPLIIRTLLPRTKPVVIPAIPEYEFRSEITTGISAPPIGRTRRMPRTADIILRPQNASGEDGSAMSQILHP